MDYKPIRTYSVYSHRDPETKEVFYVGTSSHACGVSHRQKNHHRYPRAYARTCTPNGSGRMQDHADWMHEITPEISIDFEFENRRDALDKEKELIKSLQPKFNKQGNKSYQ